MKKINYIVGLLTMTLIISCNSILEKGPLDTFSDDNFWTSESNIEGYANTFYNQFLGYGNVAGHGNFYFKTLSDDQLGGNVATWGQLDNLVTNSTWRISYVEIRRANIMIDRVSSMINLDTERQAHWIGVGRLMRAYEYYQLVRMFGDVPYTNKPLDITDEGIVYGPRDSRDVIMDNVLEDLNYAALNIADNSSKTTWSRALANAMKSEICLYEGTFRKYRKSEDGQAAADAQGATKFLTECKNASSIIMNGAHKLNDMSYQSNYNSVDLNDNPEMIFYKAYVETIFDHSLIAYTCSSTQLDGMSKSAFDSYLFTDGKPLALTSLNKSDEAPLVDGKLSMVNMLSLRDGRLAQTIDPVLMYQGNTYIRFGEGMEMTSSSGYGVSKYDNSEIPLKFRNQTADNYTDAPLFWLPIIYLSYAEACAELGAITQNDLDMSLNKLKERAGLPALAIGVGFDDPANNHDVSSLLWEIRRERRCELMFDNWIRYWDLVRWHQLDKLDSQLYPDVFLGANVFNDLDNCDADKKGNYIDGSKGIIRQFDKKYYLYPIPSGQMDLNPQLKPNNPGW